MTLQFQIWGIRRGSNKFCSCIQIAAREHISVIWEETQGKWQKKILDPVVLICHLKKKIKIKLYYLQYYLQNNLKELIGEMLRTSEKNFKDEEICRFFLLLFVFYEYIGKDHQVNAMCCSLKTMAPNFRTGVLVLNSKLELTIPGSGTTEFQAHRGDFQRPKKPSWMSPGLSWRCFILVCSQHPSGCWPTGGSHRMDELPSLAPCEVVPKWGLTLPCDFYTSLLSSY